MKMCGVENIYFTTGNIYTFATLSIKVLNTK